MEIATIGYASFYDADRRLIIDAIKAVSEGYILIDIRESAYGLVNYKELRNAIPSYHWVKEFGNPEKYENEFFKIPNQKFMEGIQRLKELIGRHNNDRVMLMCAEKDVNKCHRLPASKLIRDYFEERGHIIKINHLHSSNPPKPLRVQKTLIIKDL